MSEKRKMLYISAAINFIAGIVLGIILFYGQLKSMGGIEKIYEYDKTASLADFFRLSWLNMIWLITAFFARCILPPGIFHPIVAVRGMISSFSALYILKAFGIMEVAATLVPQAFSVLPLILYFSVETVERYQANVKEDVEPCSLKRNEVAKLFALSVLSGASEVLIFKVFCNYLF